ncbi:hypothetical protein CARUB_v10003432mg [Capsella rubella]|uniref:Uncharacterized protein n=1 Tax=Capsella rubella TaxID=81985 RepID=R0HCF9_9BRAS|nr:hypothetical protein CARUB_v10003432mg [Capsella rubella]
MREVKAHPQVLKLFGTHCHHHYRGLLDSTLHKDVLVSSLSVVFDILLTV